MNNSLRGVFTSKFYESYEMSLTFSYLQEIEVTLHFIKDGCKDKQIVEVMEATRIALQNFLFCLDQGSFYAAFTEYRICIEGILWFYVIKYEPEKISQNRIDTIDNYSLLLKRHCGELYIVWQKISQLIHQEKEIISFNINSIYEEANSYHLEFFMNLVKSSSCEFKKTINSIFSLFKYNIYIERYKMLINYWDNTRKIYKMKDYTISVHAKEKVEFPPDIQEKFINNFFSKKDENDIMYLFKIYLYGLLNSTNNLDLKEQLELDDISYIMKLVDIKKLFNDTMVSKDIENIWNTKNQSNFHISYDIMFFLYCKTSEKAFINPLNLMLYISLILYSSMLFVEEIIRDSKDIKLAILRSYLEDAIYTISINKFELYGFYNSLVFFIEKEFKFDLKELDKDFLNNMKKFRHLTPFNRISYITDEGKITGNQSYHEDLTILIFEILYNLFPKIFDCNFQDENNSKNLFYIEFIKIVKWD